MKAIEFKEQNIILTKPENMSDEECGSLNAYRGEGQYISCWKPSQEDLDRLNRGEPIWLSIMGASHPPVYVGTEYPFITNGGE